MAGAQRFRTLGGVPSFWARCGLAYPTPSSPFLVALRGPWNHPHVLVASRAFSGGWFCRRCGRLGRRAWRFLVLRTRREPRGRRFTRVAPPTVPRGTLPRFCRPAGQQVVQADAAQRRRLTPTLKPTMGRSRIALALAGATIAVILLWNVNSASDSTWIKNTTAIEPADGLQTTVWMHRAGPDLIVELRNFPSFKSQFKQPSISKSPDGSVTVSLESLSFGFVSNKSEQLTHVSMKLPSQSIPSQSRVAFRSYDYDQVFVIGVAP